MVPAFAIIHNLLRLDFELLDFYLFGRRGLVRILLILPVHLLHLHILAGELLLLIHDLLVGPLGVVLLLFVPVGD